MIIEKAERVRETLFEDLELGDTFLFGDVLYLRIPYVCVRSGDFRNALALESLEYEEFEGLSVVTPVKSRLIVEY